LDSNSGPSLTKEQIRRIVDSTFNVERIKDSISTSNALIKSPPSKYELATYEKMKKIKSAAQFLRFYFKTGNTRQQVIKVQGMPDDIVDMGNYTEVLFYGNCEITIYNNVVEEVKNKEECLNYIDTKICLMSPYNIVANNMINVMKELANTH